MVSKQKVDQKNAGKKALLSITIAIVLAFFIFTGIETFYPEPTRTDCFNARTEEACIAAGGNWQTFEDRTRDTFISCQKISESETEINLTCSNIRPAQEVPRGDGYCECHRTDAQEAYNRIIFIIATLLGLIAVIFGVVFNIPSVSSGVMGGGLLIIVVVLIRFWQYSTDVLRFVIIAILLGVLIYLGYKKLE